MIPIELESERFSIRPYHESDEHRYLEMVMDTSSQHFMGGVTGIVEKEREVFRKIFQIYQQESKRIFWIWGIYQNNLLCGHLELKETINTHENELEIVYMIHPECRKQGVMTEILHIIKNNQQKFGKQIIATVKLDNEISIKLLSKWGVAKEEQIVDKENNEVFLKLTLCQEA